MKTKTYTVVLNLTQEEVDLLSYYTGYIKGQVIVEQGREKKRTFVQMHDFLFKLREQVLARIGQTFTNKKPTS